MWQVVSGTANLLKVCDLQAAVRRLAGDGNRKCYTRDIRMPDMDGIEATRRICAASAVKVLILTTYGIDEYIFAALRAGASGFLLKDTPPADLLAGIRLVAAGEALLAPAVTRRLIEEFTRLPEPARRCPSHCPTSPTASARCSA
jgi:DNA-binding NarL/FixJ family response regulator